MRFGYFANQNNRNPTEFRFNNHPRASPHASSRSLYEQRANSVNQLTLGLLKSFRPQQEVVRTPGRALSLLMLKF